MRSSIFASLCAVFLSMMTAPALADQTVTLKVPVTLTNIPPSIAAFAVKCLFYTKDVSMVSPRGSSVAVPIPKGGSGTPNAPALVNVPVQVTSLQSTQLDGRYLCLTAFYADLSDPAALGPGMQVSELSPYIVTPSTAWSVQGRLWPIRVVPPHR